MVNSTGSLSVNTGKYTGRSPDDRFIVYDDVTHDTIDWGKVNHQFPTGKFEKIFEKMKDFVNDKELFVFDGFVGADKDSYDLSARKLAQMFIENFKKFENISPEIVNAGPKLP